MAVVLVPTVDVLATMLLVVPLPGVGEGAAEIAGVLVAALLVSPVGMVVTMLPIGGITLFPLVSEEVAEMTGVMVAALLVVVTPPEVELVCVLAVWTPTRRNSRVTASMSAGSTPCMSHVPAPKDKKGHQH